MKSSVQWLQSFLLKVPLFIVTCNKLAMKPSCPKNKDNNLYYQNTCTQVASKVDLSITAATAPALLWIGWQTTGLSMCCSMTCINLKNNLVLYQTDHYGWVARYQSINRLCCSCIFLHLSTRRERHPSTYSCCSLPPICYSQNGKELLAPQPQSSINWHNYLLLHILAEETWVQRKSKLNKTENILYCSI